MSLQEGLAGQRGSPEGSALPSLPLNKHSIWLEAWPGLGHLAAPAHRMGTPALPGFSTQVLSLEINLVTSPFSPTLSLPRSFVSSGVPPLAKRSFLCMVNAVLESVHPDKQRFGRNQ